MVSCTWQQILHLDYMHITHITYNAARCCSLFQLNLTFPQRKYTKESVLMAVTNLVYNTMETCRYWHHSPNHVDIQRRRSEGARKGERMEKRKVSGGVMKDQYRERKIMQPRERENLRRDYLSMHRDTTTMFGHPMVVTKAIRLKKHTVLFLFFLLFLYVTFYFCCTMSLTMLRQ